MHRSDSADAGEPLFLAQLALIERVIAFVCSRHHLSAADADDFASHVKLKFVENQYDILKKFEGRSSLRTYLTVVIQRLFLDYRTSAWGKWRPSAEARRAGPVAILLERLIGRDGLEFDHACETLATNHRVTMDRGDLERLAARLPVRMRRRFESDDALADRAVDDRAADDLAADGERQQLADRLSASLRKVIAGFAVQDRLILTMRFEDARTVAEIASTLRLDQKALYRRVERLLKDLREGLEAAGIERAQVLEILESPAVSIEWRKDASQEIELMSPSMPQILPWQRHSWNRTRQAS